MIISYNKQANYVKNYLELENIFGNYFDARINEESIGINHHLKNSVPEYNIDLFPCVNFQEQRFSKFKYCFDNISNRIESVFKKKTLNNNDDLEILINPKKFEFNRNNRIHYNDRFFIYPSGSISLKKYYKKKYINITNQIVTLNDDMIQYDSSNYIKDKTFSNFNLEVENSFSFCIVIDENMNDNYKKIKQYKDRNADLLSQIENYEKQLEQGDKETIALEDRKAVFINI